MACQTHHQSIPRVQAMWEWATIRSWREQPEGADEKTPHVLYWNACVCCGAPYPARAREEMSCRPCGGSFGPPTGDTLMDIYAAIELEVAEN